MKGSAFALKLAVFALLFAVISAFLFGSAVRAEENAVVEFSDSRALSGGKARVSVTLKNSPGIACFMFKLSYDPALTLVGAESGADDPGGNAAFLEASSGGQAKVIWFSMTDEVKGDGEVAVLTFVTPGGPEKTYRVGVSYGENDILNSAAEKVDVTVIEGCITTSLCGDANDDMTVDVNDVVRLKRYFAEYDETAGSPVVLGPRADANGDGGITALDVVRLKRQLAE